MKAASPRWLAVPVAIAVTAGSVLAAAPALAAPAEASPTSYTDKSALKAQGRSVVSNEALPVVDGSAPTSAGTTYYVDSIAGDDDAAGTSPNEAWKTFTHVNGVEFQPGDRILLKAGGVWDADGQGVASEAYDYTTWSGDTPTDVEGSKGTALLAPGGSGTSAAPIILSSYGDGTAPELNGRGFVNDVLQLSNQEHWDVSNLEISNVTEGFDAGEFQPAAGNGQAPGDENPKTGDLRGIHVQGENAGTLRGFDIHDVFVRDVSGVTWSVSSAGLDRSKRTGGILFEGLKGDGQTVSQFEDVTVRDSYIANTSFANLTFKQFSGMGTNRYQDRDPGWGDRAVAKASATGVITEDPDWRPHSGIHVEGNYLTNRDTQYGWDSMYLTSVQGATVEGNMIDGAGVSGIEMYYTDDVVVQNNEVAELEGRTGAADSNGIDPDRGTSNILIQNNWIHDSGEGILLCGFGFSTAVVRYNVIQDIERNYINPHGNSGVNVVYNNLMYNTVAPLKNNTVGFFESSGTASEFLVSKNPHYLFNNVFLNAREGVSGAQFRAADTGVTLDGNAYWGPGVTAPAQDANRVTGDPQIGDPGEAIENIIPGSGTSPLISSGSTVDLAEIAPGFVATGAADTSRLPLEGDFFGVAVQTPPHIGPASYRPAAGTALVSGLVVDESGLPVPGARVSFGGETVTADASGRYAIETDAGDYSLVPSADDYADGASVAVTLADRSTTRTDLTLGRVLISEGTIAGTVTGAGSGIADVVVTVSKDGATVATTTTDADGRFSLSGIPAGEGYVATAEKEGFVTASRDGLTVAAARTVDVDLTLSAEQGETVYAINETFDDEATGAFTGTSDGVLAAKANEALGTIAVVDDAEQDGNKYLRIDKSSRSSGTLAVYSAAEQNLTGIVTLEARLKRTTTNGSPNQAAMYSYTESDWKPADPSTSTNPAATVGFSNGQIITHNVRGSSSVKNVQPYTVGQWYVVRNVVDLDAGTFDFYVDDMTTPKLADQPLRSAVDELDRFSFFTNGTNYGDLLIDYFRVNTGLPYDYADVSLGSVGAVAGGEDVALAASPDGPTYSGEVSPYTDAVTIDASATSGFASVTVNGEPADKPVEVALRAGEDDDSTIVTEIPVVVTAESGAERTYTVTISRTNPNQLSQLRSLGVSGYELSPEFSPTVSGEEAPYRVTTTLPQDAASVTITWERGWNAQSIEVNGAVVAPDAGEAAVSLQSGENVIRVTANSFTGDFVTYVIVVEREGAETGPVEKRVTASVAKLKGAQNELTITVTEIDGEGAETPITKTFRIGNNAAGTYEVGPYSVYVDTKGNTQIRDVHIVE